MKRILSTIILAGVFAIGWCSVALAGAFIFSPDGSIALGVNDQGHLNTSSGVAGLPSNASALGIAYKFPDGSYRDATAPGCLCEGWGVSANNAASGYANVSTDGVQNLTVQSFTSSATNITSVVTLTSLPDLKVTQAYSPTAAVPNSLFVDHVTIQNTGASALTDVKYVRVMDWDIPPTEFSEFVTIKGTATTTLLELSHDNGFATANPLGATAALTSGTTNTDFTDVGPSDHGAYFRFNFGTLAAGDSYSFDIFYGAAATESAALAALGLVGTELYSLGQSSTTGGPTLGTPATFMFAFKGVGGSIIIPPPSAVPEPTTLLLLGGGVVAMLARRRSRKAA
ncbi:PEP-CTERM sorting domain-containing protein [Fundidesulfovibrio terrae]|uniref:PEP-CTERM sorting domain-containing protein n=1 Tax=Fundidesulfovibrio terrae TaxID=2922866 RepID=UPI001FAEE335|nr:PEP-CTERM sorting domain-containing protein [Fundidesulfovibrio terrae]